jgi:hypothetical protein
VGPCDCFNNIFIFIFILNLRVNLKFYKKVRGINIMVIVSLLMFKN